MSGCQRCTGSCQSSNTCNKCNKCEQCNTACDAGKCITVQAFCSTSGQSAGGFSFGQCVSSDELFLTKTNWNRLITHIRNAYDKGNATPSNKANEGSGVSSPGNGGGAAASGLPASDSNNFMTADMFNKVSTALGNLGSSGPSRRVQADIDVVYGSYFTTLESYANTLQYKTTQCDDCNVSCNVNCNNCLKCHNNGNCGGCHNSCQSHSPSSCCSYCNTCQSCNTCQTETTTPEGGDAK